MSTRIDFMKRQPDLMTFTTDLDRDVKVAFGKHGTWGKGHSLKDVVESIVPLMSQAICDHRLDDIGDFSISYKIYGFFPPSSLASPPDPFAENSKLYWHTMSTGDLEFSL